jgi:hypothetical protein
MKIRFEVTIDDVIALRQLQLFSSTAWYCAHLTASLLFFIVMQLALLFAIVAFDVNPLRFGVGVFFIALIVGWISGVPKAAAWIHALWTRRILRGRVGRSAVGKHEMELRDWSLIITTEVMQIAFDFRAIQAVVVLNKHAVVRIDSSQLFAIPLDRFPEHEFRTFVAELRDFWEIRHSGPPTVLRALRVPTPDVRIEKLA